MDIEEKIQVCSLFISFSKLLSKHLRILKGLYLMKEAQYQAFAAFGMTTAVFDAELSSPLTKEIEQEEKIVNYLKEVTEAIETLSNFIKSNIDKE